MKKITLVAALLGATYFANAQVGINTYTPKTSAYLDVEATDKGILIPRVALIATDEFAPIVGEQEESLLVYNTATAGTGSTAVKPGFYYWKKGVGTGHWERVTDATFLEERIGTIVKDNETLTTLVNNGDGTYTYTNEAGDVVTIDVPADVINNFEEIINNTDFQTILNEYITNNVEGNVVYDAVNNEFTYVDATGTTQVINLETIIKANETVTTLVNNGDGTYTYKNEAGVEVVIDVPADVANNFQEIINNTDVQNILNQYITNNGANVSYDGSKFTYVDATGTTQVINLETIIKANETVTTLVNNGDGTYTYTNEAGDVVTIDVPADVINNFQDIINRTEVQDILNQYITNNVEGNVVYDSVSNQFTYVDATGTTQVINLETIIKANETVTTLVNNGDGTYTYKNEAGVEVVIDVPADVANNFQEIINNTDVQNILNQYITNNGSNVSFDGSQFTYVDNTGTTQVIDLDALVKANETVTTLVNNGDGTYTYTNEAGDVVRIDVPADVINKFEDIINNTEVKNILNEYITSNGGNIKFVPSGTVTQFVYIDENGDEQAIDMEGIVKGYETVTTLLNNGDGTYTYTNEAGTAVTIDVPADVANNFQEIIDNTNVQNILNQYITNNVEGNVSYDGTNFTYVDAITGTTQVINLETIVKGYETVTTLLNNGDGTYTYTNEAGTETIISGGSSSNSETNTTLAISSGELVYTNEKGDNANVSLISADLHNGLVAGADGALYGNNLYNEDGALTESRTVNQNGNDLTFNTGTGRTIINGNFQMGGAVYGNVRTHNSSSNIVWTDTDYVVIITINGISGTLSLPDPALNAGRILAIRNNTGGTVAFSGTGFSPENLTTIAVGSGYTYISDGVNWHPMGTR